MTAAVLTAWVLELASGSVPAGSSVGGAEFRYAHIRCSLTPPAVKRGEKATLTVRLTPRAGARWHEARLLPARVEIRPAEGWEAEVSELALPPPETPDGPREFAVRLRAGEEITGYEALELRMRYGVRVPKPDDRVDAGDAGDQTRGKGAGGEPEEAERAEDSETPEAVAPGDLFPEVIFEEATLTVELPAAPSAAALPEFGGHTGGEKDGTPSQPSKGGGGKSAPDLRRLIESLPDAARADDERGGPLLPALFLALATAMVFVGLTLWVRRRR